MLDISQIEDKDLAPLISKRWDSSSSIWDKISADFSRYNNLWRNLPDWLNNLSDGRSKIRSNRLFLAMETTINTVTAKPSKPSIDAANETEEARLVSENLHELVLRKYKTLNIRKTIKRALRYLFLSKIMVIKVFWNTEIDDFDVRVVDPRKVRFSKRATNEKESEFAIEEIERPILDVITDFPDKKNDILKKAGMSMEQAIINNPDVTYKEAWIGNGVAWEFRGEILKNIPNPYYDFQGLKITPEEAKKLTKKNGRRRRQLMEKLKAKQEERIKENWAGNYELYLYNHFDKVRKPYIFASVLELEAKPTGDTSLMEQTAPLQEEGVDKRKRQIAENADFVNGITKVDTDIVTITKGEARKISYEMAKGLIYGPGVSRGVTREFGTGLPNIVFEDLEHSVREIDNIWGTQATFRGEREPGGETATGRAILREQNLLTKDELISAVDYVHDELYNWFVQLIKVNYTESHLVKPLGGESAEQVIDIMQDDLEDGIEVTVIAGQVLPDDKIFRAERAREDVKDGLIDPITYFEAAGGYDNPKEKAKRLMMWKTNPFSLVELDEDDLAALKKANDTLRELQGGVAGEGEQGTDPRAQAIAEARQRVQQIQESEEFQALDPEAQNEALAQIKERLGRLLQAQ